MTATQQNLTNLLCYAEEILKISGRIIADLAKDAFFAIHEQDVLRLEGVTVDADDGSWVRFAPPLRCAATASLWRWRFLAGVR